MKLQFSLLSLVVLLTSAAIVSALVFQIPPGHFPLDNQNGAGDHALSYRQLAFRLVACATLVAMELTGIVLRHPRVPANAEKTADRSLPA